MVCRCRAICPGRRAHPHGRVLDRTPEDPVLGALIPLRNSRGSTRSGRGSVPTVDQVSATRERVVALPAFMSDDAQYLGAAQPRSCSCRLSWCSPAPLAFRRRSEVLRRGAGLPVRLVGGMISVREEQDASTAEAVAEQGIDLPSCMSAVGSPRCRIPSTLHGGALLRVPRGKGRSESLRRARQARGSAGAWRLRIRAALHHMERHGPWDGRWRVVYTTCVWSLPMARVTSG